MDGVYPIVSSSWQISISVPCLSLAGRGIGPVCLSVSQSVSLASCMSPSPSPGQHRLRASRRAMTPCLGGVRVGGWPQLRRLF